MQCHTSFASCASRACSGLASGVCGVLSPSHHVQQVDVCNAALVVPSAQRRSQISGCRSRRVPPSELAPCWSSQLAAEMLCASMGMCGGAAPPRMRYVVASSVVVAVVAHGMSASDVCLCRACGATGVCAATSGVVSPSLPVA